MTENDNAIGILMVGHGSPRAEANHGFVDLVGRVAARLGTEVLPTFFSLAKPGIEDQVAFLAGRGLRRIVLMPYFLYTGQHVSRDIPALLGRCRAKFPGVRIEMLATLEGDPALAEVVVERLLPYVSSRPLPVEGAAIERLSHEIIERQLPAEAAGADGVARAIIRRVIHATADFSFARSMRLHPRAVQAGQEALRQGRPILCDVQMLRAGITRAAAEVLCAIGEPRTAELARQCGCTRAAAAMELMRDRLEGAIVAIGNAPTALWRVMEIAAGGGPRPALVVGLPVGFVGARESKMALIESGLVYITNTSPRGGSGVAAAAVNALALSAGGNGTEKENGHE